MDGSGGPGTLVCQQDTPDNLDSYLLTERGGLQGTDSAITTCRPTTSTVGKARQMLDSTYPGNHSRACVATLHLPDKDVSHPKV